MPSVYSGWKWYEMLGENCEQQFNVGALTAMVFQCLYIPRWCILINVMKLTDAELINYNFIMVVRYINSLVARNFIFQIFFYGTWV